MPHPPPEHPSSSQGIPLARQWLLHEVEEGLSAATINAYSRAVEGYLAYCRERRTDPRAATTAHVATYLNELGRVGLGDAARRQRLTAIRLFYTFVVEQGGWPANPVVGAASASLLGTSRATEESLSWVPDEGAWSGVLASASTERARTRLMLALAYDAALRREELCHLQLADLDPGRSTLRIPTPGRAARTVPLSAEVAGRCAEYLRERYTIGPDNEALFLSESPRNRAQPLAVWAWSKVVLTIARRAGVPHFTTHTPRHLRLTDLARAGWDTVSIARFAGHSTPSVARRYTRLAEEQPALEVADLGQRRSTQLTNLLFRESA